MLCQKEPVFQHPSPSTIPVLSLRISSTPPRDLETVPVDKHLDSQHPPGPAVVAAAAEGEEDDGERWDTTESRGAQRDQLEKDVFGLQERLRQEVELHYALETAFRQEAAVFAKHPNIPVHAQELVEDVVRLEMAISHLEDQIASLNLQLGHEQRERQKAEACCLFKLPIPTQEVPLKDSSPVQRLSEFSSVQHVQYPTPASHTNNAVQFRACGPAEGSVIGKQSYVGSPTNQSICPTDDQSEFISRSENSGCTPFWRNPTSFSPEKLKSNTCGPPTAKLCGDMKSNIEVMDLKSASVHPNRLSEEMVNCMVSIYLRLADPMDSNHSWKRTSSPCSPYGNITGSSISSFSESSLVSFAQSPPFDSQIMDVGNDRSFVDPYKTHEKLPWADIGNYNTVIAVSEMMVGKEQLDYAAEALRVFRSLVEQLSRVDPSSMKHDEKLAFWINIYNALMMHAYLAYGVPKNDFKFFSLMQKAAYTVGGHSFNAVVIEHLLLKAKAQWYRPQIALLLAHQKLKLRDEVSSFAIDHEEPLVTFSLSFGAGSSPAVRVYTAENVHDELKSALQDYARASVGLSMRGKLLIPKLLFDFASDLVEESEIPEWICQFLPCQQSSLIQNCIKHRQQRFLNSKHFSVLPFNFRFLYLFIPSQNQR